GACALRRRRYHAQGSLRPQFEGPHRAGRAAPAEDGEAAAPPAPPEPALPSPALFLGLGGGVAGPPAQRGAPDDGQGCSVGLRHSTSSRLQGAGSTATISGLVKLLNEASACPGAS